MWKVLVIPFRLLIARDAHQKPFVELLAHPVPGFTQLENAAFRVRNAVLFVQPNGGASAPVVPHGLATDMCEPW